jgi:hypothetical protein
MKKPFLFKIISFILFLTVVPTATFLSSCDNADKSTTVDIPRQLDQFSMADMWAKVAQATDLQKETAGLGSLHLTIDETGVIKSLYFDFNGRSKNGRTCLYFASLNYKNKIVILKYETDSVRLSKNPQSVFSEIDKVGLASIERGDEGLTVHIDFQWGDIGFNHDYLDAYQLQDGNLLPLEELIFHTGDPICVISLFKNYVTEGTTSITVLAGPVPPGERTSQIWFLSEDINKAEMIKYIDTKQE